MVAPASRDTALLTLLTMVCFAGNALCARAALGGHNADGTPLIDDATYTVVRILAAVGVLLFVTSLQKHSLFKVARYGYWVSGVAFASYAFAYAWGYVWLDAGFGSLLQFTAVQATMLGYANYRGERLISRQKFGVAFAMLGLMGLLWPTGGSLSISSSWPVVAMVLSGILWGAYSVPGQDCEEPWLTTAGNFLWALPVAVPIFLLSLLLRDSVVSPIGLGLAILSGAITTGLGCVWWYLSQRRLDRAPASIVQLIVPVFATLGGLLFLGEHLTAKAALSGVVILLGVGLAIFKRSARHAQFR